MSIEANKTLIRRMIEEDLNTGDPAVTEQVFATDFFDHTNPPGMQHGWEGHKQILKLFRAAFPDVMWTITDMIAEGDKVMVRLIWRGTHTGDFFGIPATGKTVEVHGTHLLRVANGRIVEHWGNDDDLGLMRQLGLVPEMS